MSAPASTIFLDARQRVGLELLSTLSKVLHGRHLIEAAISRMTSEVHTLVLSHVSDPPFLGIAFLLPLGHVVLRAFLLQTLQKFLVFHRDAKQFLLPVILVQGAFHARASCGFGASWK